MTMKGLAGTICATDGLRGMRVYVQSGVHSGCTFDESWVRKTTLLGVIFNYWVWSKAESIIFIMSLYLVVFFGYKCALLSATHLHPLGLIFVPV